MALAAIMGLLLGGAAQGEAASYTFTKIADTSGPFSVFAIAGINDRGAVAFSAALDTGLRGIFTGDGTNTTTIADSSGPFNFFGMPSFNDSGIVAVKVFLDVGGSAIVRSDGTAITTIASTSNFSSLGNPSINDGGIVAFFGLDRTGRGIFTSDGTAITTIAHTGGPFSGLLDNPAIANEDKVAFLASDAGGIGIFRSDGTTTTTIAHTGGPFSGLGFPSVNTGGMVAFWASLDAGGIGIFTSDGTAITTIADSNGPFLGGNSPSINDRGRVAFWASLDAGGSGIFTGPNPSTDKVIAVGDPLAGSTVTELIFGREGLNGTGQIAFVARLTDGTQGVYRADPVAYELQVIIDIRPGGNPNTINLRSKGTIAVAILSTATFDAATVDPRKVTLAGAPVKLKKNGTPMAAYEDANGDGHIDLVVHVSTQDLQLDGSSIEAVLKGQTSDGTDIIGSNTVRIVP